MYNPDNFVAPKKSRRELMLEKHGYYESTIRDGVRSLTVTKQGWIDRMNLSPECTDEEITTMYVYGRHDFDLYSEKDESFSNWMLRLGWLKHDADGHIVEA